VSDAAENVDPEELQRQLSDIKGAMGLAEQYPGRARLWLVAGLIIGVAALLALGALAVLTSVVTGDRASIGPSEDDAADVDLAGIADAAGDAADRIEAEAEVSNAVYRAWREMVGHLDVDSPETTTPAEFRRRAVDAGMAADDVAELTRLFEEVRYGEGDPDVRASAAVAALRRIEASHASEGEP